MPPRKSKRQKSELLSKSFGIVVWPLQSKSLKLLLDIQLSLKPSKSRPNIYCYVCHIDDSTDPRSDPRFYKVNPMSYKVNPRSYIPPTS